MELGLFDTETDRVLIVEVESILPRSIDRLDVRVGFAFVIPEVLLVNWIAVGLVKEKSLDNSQG